MEINANTPNPNNYKIAPFFDSAYEASKGCTSVAATGSSGAGKTTSIVMLIRSFASQFLYTNIGAVQSSKIRMALVPLLMKNNEDMDNLCLRITLASEYNVDLVISTLLELFTKKIVNTRGNFNEDDAAEIAEQMLAATNRIYDISGYFDDETEKQLVQDTLKLSKDIIQDNLTAIKDKAKLELEVNNRISAIDLKNYRFREIIKGGLERMVKQIKDKIYDWTKFDDESKRLIIEEKGGEIVVYVNKENGDAANELFSYLFEKDGKDLVISHLTLLAAMSDELEDVLYNKMSFTRSVKPIFKMYDLKGLETKDSINETIINIRESMPDLILAYQRTNDTAENFVSYLNALQSEFPRVPVNVILTHADESIKAIARNKLKCYGAPKRSEDGYTEFRMNVIRESYEQVIDGSKPYFDCVQKRNDSKVIVCTMIEEDIDEIEQVLKEANTEPIYQPTQIMMMIAKFCRQGYNRYKHIIGISSQVINSINITFNEEKLDKLVAAFVKNHANLIHKPSSYYQQRFYNPHWNTVYKWRAEHRVGSGWTSNAQKYDNISIYIVYTVSGLLNRNEIVDAIDIDVPNISYLNQDTDEIKAKLRENWRVNMEDYNGFFTCLKRFLTYECLRVFFETTYYKDALELVADALNNPDYVKSAMKATLKWYSPRLLSKSFEPFE